MLLSPKRPGSEEKFSWDCRADIQSGAGGTIASIIAIYEQADDGSLVDPSSVTVLTTPTLDATGFIVSAMLGGGTAGVTHKMTVAFTTTEGEKLFHTIAFDCRAVVVG